MRVLTEQGTKEPKSGPERLAIICIFVLSSGSSQALLVVFNQRGDPTESN
jgi:hypothetical protein